MKLYNGVRIAEGTLDLYGRQANADEIAKVRGTFYATRMTGARALVRVARQDYGCASSRHDGSPDAIKRGDVYVETLVNGSRDSGMRVCFAHAVESGDAWINPPLIQWDVATRTWIKLDA